VKEQKLDESKSKDKSKHGKDKNGKGKAKHEKAAKPVLTKAHAKDVKATKP